jgi:MFS transporter, FSR family, fosmidomycin resistance protein
MFPFLRSTELQKSLFLLCLGHFMLDFFTGIWPIYKTMANFDLAEAGLIAGCSGFLGESLQLGFGYFCDKGYRKKILILGLLCGSCILWITFSQSLISCFWILLLLTLGSSSFHPAGVGFAGGLTDAHKAKTILFFSSAGMLGLAISQIVFTRVLQFCNGHALLLFLPLAVVLFFLFSHKFPESQLSNMKILSRETLLISFAKAKKTLLLLYFAQLTNYSLLLAFLFLLPDVLVHKTNHPWLTMGGGHFCFILGSACALPPAGILCDRFGQRKVLITTICIGLVLFYTLLQIPYLTLLMGSVLLFCLGSCMNSINPIVVSWGHKIMPDNPSTISALLMGFAWCFAHLGPLSAGLLCKCFEQHAVIQTLYYLGFLLVLTLICSLLVPASRPAVLEVQDL